MAKREEDMPVSSFANDLLNSNNISLGSATDSLLRRQPLLHANKHLQVRILHRLVGPQHMQHNLPAYRWQ